jgi:hypothetical protein
MIELSWKSVAGQLENSKNIELLNNTLLSKQLVREEIKSKIRKHFQTNENENVPC